MNLFVLVVPALILLWQGRRWRVEDGVVKAPLAPSADTASISRGAVLLLLLVILAQVAEFSVVGGAPLARYMIPAVPLAILLSVDVLRRYAPAWHWWIAGIAMAFIAALLFNPPWYISPEDNLTWTNFVEMHEQAAHFVQQHYAEHHILTAWPASDELNRPFLGYLGRYVDKPLTVVRIENFSAEQVLAAARQPESYDVVVAFSTKFEPQHGFLQHIPGVNQIMERYFDFHRDLQPDEIAHLLHGQIVFRASSPGEWIAVIEVNKVRLAKATPLSPSAP
jgi:hypothetical protein